MARNTARSVIDGMTFSTPITATCTRGSEVAMRPLPSLVTRTTVPVSATAKLAPVMPRSAVRNFSRNSSRAILVRTSGSAGRPGRFSSRENSSATWPFVLWLAGAMMRQALEGRLRDGAGTVAQPLPLGKVAEGLAAQRDELGGRDIERLVQESVAEGLGGALPQRRGHDRLGHRINRRGACAGRP